MIIKNSEKYIVRKKGQCVPLSTANLQGIEVYLSDIKSPLEKLELTIEQLIVFSAALDPKPSMNLEVETIRRKNHGIIQSPSKPETLEEKRKRRIKAEMEEKREKEKLRKERAATREQRFRVGRGQLPSSGNKRSKKI